MKQKIIKPATNQELADFLCRSKKTVDGYPIIKLHLMRYGLATLMEEPGLKPFYLKLKKQCENKNIDKKQLKG